MTFLAQTETRQVRLIKSSGKAEAQVEEDEVGEYEQGEAVEVEFQVAERCEQVYDISFEDKKEKLHEWISPSKSLENEMEMLAIVFFGCQLQEVGIVVNVI